MEWILCFQTPTGGVKYFTSDLDNPTYLPFRKFLSYINQFNLMEFQEFQEELDKFKTIFIDVPQKNWEIYEVERDQDISFMDLYSFNEQRKQQESQQSTDLYRLEDKKDLLDNNSKITSRIGRKRDIINDTK